MSKLDTRRAMKWLKCLFMVFSVGIADGGITSSSSAISDHVPEISEINGAVSLSGKLAFCVTTGTLNWNVNPLTNSVIYEIDLASGQILEIAKVPDGTFVPSLEGDGYCVIYAPNKKSGSFTNAVVIMTSLGIRRQITLNEEPSGWLFAHGHVLFRFNNYSDQHTVDSGLVDYEPRNDKLVVDQYEGTRWNAISDEIYGTKTFDGHYVFFDGKPGSSAPRAGSVLLVSEWNDFEYRFHFCGARVLHRFSGWLIPSSKENELLGLSPDRRYALVCSTEWSFPKVTRKVTYFYVDVTNGKTHVLLSTKESSERVISNIWWLPQSGRTGSRAAGKAAIQ